MEETIIIIGAGIAGLATGCYAQMNGFRTRIFEQHDKPGGVCTAWKRQGYTFDGCVQWLVGSGPGSSLHPIWQELGAVQGRSMVYHDVFLRVEGSEGQVFTVYTDIERLAEQMKALSPQDASTIDELAQAAHGFRRFELPALLLSVEKAPELLGLFGWAKLAATAAPLAPLLYKWTRITIGDFASGFRDPFLRRAFPLAFPLGAQMPMALFLATLASWHDKEAGYPVGGSLPFAQAIADRYRYLGGEIHYKSRVDQVIVKKDWTVPYEAGWATGVRLRDESEYEADVIVSAADGYSTIYNLLEGRYKPQAVRDYYQQVPTSQGCSLRVSIGVSREFPGEPRALVLLLDKPVEIAGKMRDRLEVQIYNFDPTLAPAGKTVIEVPLESGYGYWSALRDAGRYRQEKDRIGEVVISLLEKRFPGLREQIEVVDVATPLTTERFTRNWRGLQAWLPQTSLLTLMRKGLSRTLPGLENFYMVGQWAEGMIGLPTAAISGRHLVQRLCRKYRRRFVAQIP